MTTPIQIALVTCPPDSAHPLAQTLIEQRVAACVNVIPNIASTYRWQGRIQQDDESLLIIKTTADRFADLKLAVLAAHPYELPEIIAVSVSDGHAPYLDWIFASTRP